MVDERVRVEVGDVDPLVGTEQGVHGVAGGLAGVHETREVVCEHEPPWHVDVLDELVEGFG